MLPLTERWWNGFAFVPAAGTLAFSDHRLGLSLIASPLQWLGCSPITAYNIVWLATFPLCALAAHALAFTLTRRTDASVICGLAYGFNPYRAAHLSHLDCWGIRMPAALAAIASIHQIAGRSGSSLWPRSTPPGVVLTYSSVLYRCSRAVVLWFDVPRCACDRNLVAAPTAAF